MENLTNAKFSVFFVCFCVHQVAKTATNPESRLCGKEDHPCCAHRPGLLAFASEHVPHSWSEEVSHYLSLFLSLAHSSTLTNVGISENLSTSLVPYFVIPYHKTSAGV